MFAEIGTPAVLVDLDIAEANIDRFQAFCDKSGLRLRPHIKTHKLPFLAKRQLAAGAVGITCQKISEARAMLAEGGIDDILITFPIVGTDKCNALRELARDVKRLGVVTDSSEVIEGLSQSFASAPRSLDVMIECDTGGGRCGVQSPQEAVALAQKVSQSPGLRFAGIMTYPPVGREGEVDAWIAEAIAACEAAGLTVPLISTGGSPGMWRARAYDIETEYRIGTYVYNDRSLVAHGACDWKDCALSVLATVVSVPTVDRAIIDAGSKVLTSDLMGQQGHGYVVGRPDIAITNLSEEHGTLRAPTIDLKVGDRVRIIPNHSCVVSNMLDHVQLVRGTRHEGSAPVIARGQVL